MCCMSPAGMARSLADTSAMSSTSMATCEMLTSGNQKMGSNTLVALLKGDSSRLLHFPTPCPPYKNLHAALYHTLALLLPMPVLWCLIVKVWVESGLALRDALHFCSMASSTMCKHMHWQSGELMCGLVACERFATDLMLRTLTKTAKAV